MIELSFCIPTYNRSQSSSRLVKEILSICDASIEVVVLDNDSPDNTLELLNTIEDKRLKVYSNDRNKGALFNMINVLSKAQGKYLVYSTDQDFVNSLNIIDFKNFLINSENIACGYCEFVDDTSSKQNQIFQKGYEAINNVAYLSRHPSGYFFYKDMLEQTNYLDRFSNYDYVDLFPFEFIFAELCTLGNAAVYNQQLSIPERRSNIVSANQSSTTKGSSLKAFFTPSSRLKMTLNYSKHSTQLVLDQNQKKILILNVFMRGLISATVEYKALLASSSLCHHYYIEPRKINFFELIYM